MRYDDFRKYLADSYAFRKSRDRGFSYGVFARRAGLSTRGHLESVIGGRIGLTESTLPKYVHGLRLGAEEAEYFGLLVRANQAGAAEREGAFAALRRWKARRTWRRQVPEGIRELMESWPRFLVFCLTRLRGFRPEPLWISRRLLGRVSPAEAREALSFLRRQGFIRLWGGRLVDTQAGSLRFEGRGSLPFDIDAMRQRVLREAIALAGSRGHHGEPGMAFLVLNRQEAIDLGRGYLEWLLTHLPQRRKRSAPGELCAVFADVFPLSGRGAPPRRFGSR